MTSLRPFDFDNPMKIDAIAKFVYGLFGAVFLIVGATVLMLHTGLLPEPVKNIVMGFARGDSLAVHLIQELGSILVFAGLITFWFIRHYEHSKAYHWAMTTPECIDVAAALRYE